MSTELSVVGKRLPAYGAANKATGAAKYSVDIQLPGMLVGRLLHNLTLMPRVVGGLTPGCAGRGAELYRKIVKAPIYETDCLTAEIAKLAENAYRDVNIAFANEVALICESLGSDVHEVRRYVNSLPHDPSDSDKNPYRMMMAPGAGVGGPGEEPVAGLRVTTSAGIFTIEFAGVAAPISRSKNRRI